MKVKVYAAILAGGSGSRLWPLSRNLLPKQFIKVGKELSFFEKTVKRISKITSHKNILAVTNKNHALGAGYRQFRNLKILIEPIARNTASAIGLAAVYAKKISGSDPVLIVLPSDHLIEENKQFEKVIKKAVKEALLGKIVTLGIVPNWPETGYGYIKVDKKALKFNSRIFKVREFAEKPNLEEAKKFIKSGKYFWNSGIFVFKVSTILKEFEKYLPVARKNLEKIYSEVFLPKKINYKKLENYFSKMPNISIDYAIMEKSNKVYTIPSKFGWSDVGSWHYFYKFLPKDKNGNAKFGDIMEADSKNNLLYSDSRLIASIGIEDLAVIETADAILISDIHRSQEVRGIVSKLKEAKRREFNEHLTIERPWGSFRVLLDLADYRIKKIKINPRQKIEFRYHKSSLRHWFVAKGKGEAVLGDKKIILKSNSHMDIPKNVKYMVRNTAANTLEIIEIQTGKYSAAGDVVKINMNLKRY